MLGAARMAPAAGRGAALRLRHCSCRGLAARAARPACTAPAAALFGGEPSRTLLRARAARKLPLGLRTWGAPSAAPPLGSLRAASALTEVQAVDTPAQNDAALPPHAATVVLDVGGMKCGGCSAAVKRMLLQQPGVAAAAVNLLTETAALQIGSGDPATLGPQAAELLTSKGFPSKVRNDEEAAVDSDAAEARRLEEARRANLNLAAAWGLVLVCCSHHAGHVLHSLGYHQFAHGAFMEAMGNPLVSGALGAFALLGPGRRLLADGFRALWLGNPNMNSLVGVGSSASFLVGAASFLVPSLGLDTGFLEEPVMLLAFVLLGRALESRAKVQAASDLKALAKLIPATARLQLDPGAAPGAAAAAAAAVAAGGPAVEYLQVSTRSVRRGDIVRVLPGERVPVDGEVIEGQAALDESMLTGESVLVPKAPGSRVSGGTVCYEGPLTVRATATGAESTLAGIGRLVAEAQSREAPVQRLADAVAGRFCYGVMAASALTFAFWQLIGTELFPSALAAAPNGTALLLAVKLAVDVLVVACPCALGLATPTAVLVASSMGARRGLLLRGGDVLERVAGVDTVVLDKTGTLTLGRLELSSVRLPGGGGSGAGAGAEADAVVALAAAVEASTRHPLADAVAAAAAARRLSPPPVVGAATHPGDGASAEVDGARVLVGRPGWVLPQLAPGDADAAAALLAAPQRGGEEKQTVVVVARAGRLLGVLGFKDELRPDAASTVAALRRMGIRVQLLSGDDEGTARAVAARAGIEAADARGGMSPADKLEAIRALQASGARVAMVGDGVNDAPALAAADAGIALKGGLDAAGEAAAVVLMGDRLSQVVDCIDLGRATLSKIRQNLVWALCYNLVGIPLAAGALLPTLGVALSPSAAGGMMAFSSVAVVGNSLLLRATAGGRGRPAAPAGQRPQAGGGGGGGGGAAAAPKGAPGELPV
ncbi:copper-transporting ATPase chloroplastic [Raphidocelis subcapitata]|uniref:Copper-transporting ATPase chloroplastic n=1 Tax=Raphidocelis subcapitata TaxID=307507 RepID=A0A2V0PA87_9CHLO|nr:copper-transporting ATPase chloroplastic [Raphidocelis subcapitata]|eukprot:GBF96439.1 copper-transporting ATPase chloroplastic [Raphidocelis subcapitata]